MRLIILLFIFVHISVDPYLFDSSCVSICCLHRLSEHYLSIATDINQFELWVSVLLTETRTNVGHMLSHGCQCVSI